MHRHIDVRVGSLTSLDKERPNQSREDWKLLCCFTIPLSPPLSLSNQLFIARINSSYLPSLPTALRGHPSRRRADLRDEFHFFVPGLHG